MRKKEWVYTDVGSAHQAELIVRNVWLLSGRLAVCLSGERDDTMQGWRMVITPTSRAAGVETLECFEAGIVISATVWGESGCITFVEPHRQLLTSVMCEKFGFNWNDSLFLSLALRSISQWPLISLHPMVRFFFFFQCSLCFLFWICSPCCWATGLNQFLP